jgi:chemotaxis protein MotA
LARPLHHLLQNQSILSGEPMLRKKIHVAVSAVLILLSAVLLWRLSGVFFINLPGLLLVLGGTYLASVISHTNGRVLELLRRVPLLLREPPAETFDDRRAFLQMAGMYRRGDVRGAERAALELRDEFLRNGARLALDPQGAGELNRMLQWQLRQCKERDAGEVRILRTMATFAPAFGMLGTLFGLVSLLGDLGNSGLEQIGLTMGFALMSTLYGLLAANLLFRPLALKLEERSRGRLHHMGFLLEALVMLHQRQHPLAIGEYLDSEMPPAQPGSQPRTPAATDRLALRGV